MTQSVTLKELLGDDVSAPKRLSLAEEATEKLREFILIEKLPPGFPLNERDLSAIMGISRTPVREAIRQLEKDGLVEYTQTRRPRVADPTMETLAQWLLILAALEALAVEQACQNASRNELKYIAAKFDEMVENASEDDPILRFTLDMEFHRRIVAAAHIPALVETHEQYNARLWRARYLSTLRQMDRREQAFRHKPILDALLARDGEAAARAMKSHLGNAIGNIKTAIQEREANHNEAEAAEQKK
ncbi:MAG: GntR family transcriptional regulator [Pseudomonadota bacterium]